MHLILDFGNTALKASLFDGETLSGQLVFQNHSAYEILRFIEGKKIERAILASVVQHSPTLESELRRKFPVLSFNQDTALPVKNSYATPATLGYDRMAAAIRAWQLFPGSPVLAVVAGSCVTYNIINKAGEFTGGAIAPGLHMRLRAMHEFTDKLPLVALEGDHPLAGNSTETSLRSGVYHAAVEETRGMIRRYETEFPGLKIVLGGGDSAFLAEGLKNGIFARPNLVPEGLNCILSYHVANKLL
jgi:type III pantothenate kinase